MVRSWLHKLRSNYSSKIISYVTALGFILFLYKCLKDIHNNNFDSMDELQRPKLIMKLDKRVSINKLNFGVKNELKYILQWTLPNTHPFNYLGKGQRSFIERKCNFTNCYVTGNKTYLDDVTEYDVIAFSGEQLLLGKYKLPERRSPHQKYVFACMESSDNYPVCSSKYDNLFNWTWTYRTDANAIWGYIAIRDSNGKVIGPSVDMHWMKLSEMRSVSIEFKEQLRSKRKAVAWFVSNCGSRSGREIFVKKLNVNLKKFNLSVDIYGDCGSLKCVRDRQDECNRMLSTDYYFYLALENSFAKDYVTEKLLYPLKNNVVPIVYGAANYSRFMPDGIYLNARALGPKKLAAKMNELISNPEMYADYFKWKSHYSYHYRSESPETDDICRFCEMLNDKELVETNSVYENFRKWWNPPYRC